MNPLLRRAATLTAAAATLDLLVARPWLRSGATTAEVHRALPGDTLVPHPAIEATRGITIAAPVAQVWPWLVQMGHKRAGWYGIDRFDNDGRVSATQIVPELQHLALGDVIPDAMGPFGFRVAALEEQRVIGFHATIHPITGRPIRLGDPEHRTDYLDFSWVFVLEEVGPATTRLVVRVRYAYEGQRWITAIVHLFELADFVFSRRMLPGVKRRAEGRARATLPASAPQLVGAGPAEKGLRP